MGGYRHVTGKARPGHQRNVAAAGRIVQPFGVIPIVGQVLVGIDGDDAARTIEDVQNLAEEPPLGKHHLAGRRQRIAGRVPRSTERRRPPASCLPASALRSTVLKMGTWFSLAISRPTAEILRLVDVERNELERRMLSLAVERHRLQQPTDDHVGVGIVEVGRDDGRHLRNSFCGSRSELVRRPGRLGRQER